LFISGVRLRAPRARGRARQKFKKKNESNLKNNDEK